MSDNELPRESIAQAAALTREEEESAFRFLARQIDTALGACPTCHGLGLRTTPAASTRMTGGHSVKPDAMLDLVEEVSPGPYVELFARRSRIGWDSWGDEVAPIELSEAA